MVVLNAIPTFESLLQRSALVVLAIGLVWAAVVVGAIAVEAVTDGRVRVALALGCPRWCHRWLLGLLGAALTATVLTPSPAPANPSSSSALEGLPLPDRPTGA